MIKILLSLLCTVLFIWVFNPAIAYAACTGSTPTWSCTPDYDSINGCINGSGCSGISAGDTINVSAGDGTETWSSQLIINKGVTLKGAGSTKTIITAGLDATGSARALTQYLIVYYPSNPENDEPFRLTGFTFDCASRIQALKLFNPTLHKQTKIRIDNNRFINGLPGPPITEIKGTFYGVMDSNYIFKNASNNNALDVNNGVDLPTWYNSDYEPGSGNAFFFEDNICDLTDVAHDVGEGGKVVVRYNTYNMIVPNLTRSAMMVHGAQAGAHTSNMGLEYYGNDIKGIANVSPLIGSRGGIHLGFYNKITAPGTTYIALGNMYPDNCPDKCASPYDSGTDFVATPNGKPQHVSNSYFWINKDDGQEVGAYVNMDCCTGLGGYGPWSDCCIHGLGNPSLQANSEWWEYKQAFDGKAGVGCGTLAARPATCTTGVGYWATTQDCNNLNGMVGVAPSTPISGTLYKCTSTDTWTSYYTPYTYPHPLRGSESSGATPPIFDSVTATPSGGTSTYGQQISLQVVLSQAVDTTDHIKFTLNDNQSTVCEVGYNLTNQNVATCSFTVARGMTATNLSATMSVKGTGKIYPTGTTANETVNFTPTANIPTGLNIAAGKVIVLEDCSAGAGTCSAVTGGAGTGAILGN